MNLASLISNTSIADVYTRTPSYIGSGAYSGGIPVNVTLHAWPVPQFNDPKGKHEDGSGVERSEENAKNYSGLHNLNATGYVAIEDDLIETGFTDIQTFILAGIATVIPLLVAVATVLGIRFIWKKYRTRKEDGYEGVLQKDESSEPLGKLRGYSIPQELKTSESQFTMTPDEQGSFSSPQLPTPMSNGSIITMTLKNNHLIVETEETENIPATLKIESKGTTTKFVTPKAPNLKLTDRINGFGDNFARAFERGSTEENHGALVHCPAEDIEDELDKGSYNTGLSQSDLSVSSAESQNPSYRYGNQSGYDSGGYGYPEYSGYTMNAQKEWNLSYAGPKDRTPGYCKSSSVLEYSNSLAGARQDPGNVFTNGQVQEKNSDTRYDEEQRALGNGEVLVEAVTTSQKAAASDDDRLRSRETHFEASE